MSARKSSTWYWFAMGAMGVVLIALYSTSTDTSLRRNERAPLGGQHIDVARAHDEATRRGHPQGRSSEPPEPGHLAPRPFKEIASNRIPERRGFWIELLSGNNAGAHLTLRTPSPHFRVVVKGSADERDAPVVHVLKGADVHSVVRAERIGPVKRIQDGGEPRSLFLYALRSLDRLVIDAGRVEELKIQVSHRGYATTAVIKVSGALYGPQISFADSPSQDGLLETKAFVSIARVLGIRDVVFTLYSGMQQVDVVPSTIFVGAKSLHDLIGKRKLLRNETICVTFWSQPSWAKLPRMRARFTIVSMLGETFEVSWEVPPPESDK